MIQNVKLTNLERIARLFGAQILPNLASLVSIPTLGLCEKFHNVFYEQQQKNLVYLEGTITNCTYLSKGGFFSESVINFFQISKSQKKNIPKNY